MNNVRQPGNMNLDLSMSKGFVLRHGHRLQFQADAYNVLGISTRAVSLKDSF